MSWREHGLGRRTAFLAQILALTAIYFGCGKFGLSLAFVNKSASAVWPPTGVALAALLLGGKRLWPGVFLGALLVNITTQGTAPVALGIALGNTLESVLGASLAERFAAGSNAFEHPADIFRFVLLTALLSTTASASIGVLTLSLGGYAAWNHFFAIWFTWWLGDVVSAVIIAPVLLLWFAKPANLPAPGRFLEAAILAVLVLWLAHIIFFNESFGGRNYPLEYLAIPPLLWAAFRFGQRGAATFALILSSVALWATRHELGPFVRPEPNESLLLLQTFMGTTTLTAIVLASIVSARQRAENRLQIQDAVSRVLAEAPSLTAATPRVLQALCEKAGWDYAALWLLSRNASELSLLDQWHSPSLPASQFEPLSRQTSCARGVGLPGRVWVSAQPLCVLDMTRDPAFASSIAPARNRLRTAICFPLKLHDEICGVVECFNRQMRRPDEDFVQMLAVIGAQLGQFLERTRAQQELAEAQDKLRRHALELEQRVQERTARLQQSVESLDSLCYSIAHDLRAPLRSVRGFSNALVKDYAAGLDPTARDYLQRIRIAAGHMDRLILDLLEYGRLDATDVPVETVAPEPLIQNILASLESELSAKKGTVNIEVPLLPLIANPVLLEQVLGNLLDNALKFVPSIKPPEIRIWTETRNHMVRLCVCDNGIGIKPEYVQKLFQPFVRLVNGSEFPGTGIGLAIVRKATERMGGKAGVESRPGEGSCFWVELPCPHSERPVEPPKNQVAN